jgi:hypothetical protein
MTTERQEPTYLFSEKQVAERSELARRFLDHRARLNENVDHADNYLVKRFYNLDHNTYLSAGEIQGVDGPGCLRQFAL